MFRSLLLWFRIMRILDGWSFQMGGLEKIDIIIYHYICILTIYQWNPN